MVRAPHKVMNHASSIYSIVCSEVVGTERSAGVEL